MFLAATYRTDTAAKEKTLVPYDPEAAVVRKILESGGEGRSITEIVTSLNAQGFMRRNGKPWTPRQVWAILSRRGLYECGRLHYGKVEGANERFIIQSDRDVS